MKHVSNEAPQDTSVMQDVTEQIAMANEWTSQNITYLLERIPTRTATNLLAQVSYCFGLVTHVRHDDLRQLGWVNNHVRQALDLAMTTSHATPLYTPLELASELVHSYCVEINTQRQNEDIAQSHAELATEDFEDSESTQELEPVTGAVIHRDDYSHACEICGYSVLTTDLGCQNPNCQTMRVDLVGQALEAVIDRESTQELEPVDGMAHYHAHYDNELYHAVRHEVELELEADYVADFMVMMSDTAIGLSYLQMEQDVPAYYAGEMDKFLGGATTLTVSTRKKIYVFLRQFNSAFHRVDLGLLQRHLDEIESATSEAE